MLERSQMLREDCPGSPKGKAKGVAHKLMTETGDDAQCREGGGAQIKKVDRIVAGVGKEELRSN